MSDFQEGFCNNYAATLFFDSDVQKIPVIRSFHWVLSEAESLEKISLELLVKSERKISRKYQEVRKKSRKLNSLEIFRVCGLLGEAIPV